MNYQKLRLFIGLFIQIWSVWASIPIPGEHFYTTNEGEVTNAITHLGYVRESDAGYVFPASRPDLQPLYRLYNPSISRHFYTTSLYERDKVLQGGGWANEGIGGYVYASQETESVPFYRLFNGPLFDHLYTTSSAEVAFAEKNGYQLEGIQCYLPISTTGGIVTLFRLYRKCPAGQNPNSMIKSQLTRPIYAY